MWTLREALSGKLGRAPSKKLLALACVRFVWLGRHSFSVHEQAACCVIDRAGPEQKNRVGDPAIHHGLLQRSRLAGGPMADPEWRPVGRRRPGGGVVFTPGSGV